MFWMLLFFFIFYWPDFHNGNVCACSHICRHVSWSHDTLELNLQTIWNGHYQTALKRQTKLDCKQQKCCIGTDGAELPVALLHVSREKEDNEATAVIAPLCFQTFQRFKYDPLESEAGDSALSEKKRAIQLKQCYTACGTRFLDQKCASGNTFWNMLTC